MNATVSDYLGWVGVWTGIGETQAGQPTLIRSTFEFAMDGNGLEMHFEAWDPDVNVLFHGVHSVLARAPSGMLRALGFSTIHGPLILELMPDDAGVMALSGDSQTGNRISVTFVEEAPDQLLFTAFWRTPDQPFSSEATPRMTCTLKRGSPWKPGPPANPKDSASS